MGGSAFECKPASNWSYLSWSWRVFSLFFFLSLSPSKSEALNGYEFWSFLGVTGLGLYCMIQSVTKRAWWPYWNFLSPGMRKNYLQDGWTAFNKHGIPVSDTFGFLFNRNNSLTIYNLIRTHTVLSLFILFAAPARSLPSDRFLLLAIITLPYRIRVGLLMEG